MNSSPPAPSVKVPVASRVVKAPVLAVPEPIAVPEPGIPSYSQFPQTIPESSSIPEPIPQPEPETNYNPDLGLLMNQNQIIENGPETIPEDKEVHPTIVPNDPEL